MPEGSAKGAAESALKAGRVEGWIINGRNRLEADNVKEWSSLCRSKAGGVVDLREQRVLAMDDGAYKISDNQYFLADACSVEGEEKMNDVVKTAWADAGVNKELFYVTTYSGYRSSRADPQGVEHQSDTEIDDHVLGTLVLDALAHSRFVLPEPRSDVWIHPEATFDMDLYDRDLSTQRYDQWVSRTLERWGYKSKRALFKDMKKCSIERKEGHITFRPSHHEKLEVWTSKGINDARHVHIPSDSSPSEVGAALRLAFSRCT